MARSAALILRDTLEEFLAGEQHAHLLRLRDPGDDGAPASRARGRWLISAAGSDAFAEARESGELATEATTWLERQLRRVPHTIAALRADAELRAALAEGRLPSGEALDLPMRLARLARADDEQARAGEAREIEHALRPIALQHVAAHARAEETLLVRRPPAGSPTDPGDLRQAPQRRSLIISAFSAEGLAEQAARDLPDEPWLADAATFLSSTQGAAEEAVERCARKLGAGRPLAWHALLRALRAPELDSDSGAKLRWRRVAAWLSALGFERELNARMRAEIDRGAMLPFGSVVALSVPLDLRVAQSAIDCGAASDLFAAGGVGYALGLSLVHAALPTELRWPLGASAAGTIGALALQLWGERAQLMRVQRLSESAAQRVGQLAGALALLRARAEVAIALAPLADAGKPEARQQALAEALGRALCCDLPESIAGLLGANRVAARARALEALAGLSLHVGLRERFDADWFRNPRSEELLRGVCASGNRLTPEDVCAEVTTTLSAAAGRAVELVA
jgi:hypothetical protein